MWEMWVQFPGLGRSLGEGNGNPLHYSCLENSMDKGAWWATVHEIAESDATEQASLPFISEWIGEEGCNQSRVIVVIDWGFIRGGGVKTDPTYI